MITFEIKLEKIPQQKTNKEMPQRVQCFKYVV